MFKLKHSLCATFGDTTTGTAGWNLAANRSIFSDYVLSETADITSMTFYINTNSGSGTYTLELGIYSSSSGQPVTKQVSAERTDVPHGSSTYQWVTVNMTLNGLAAATYCLGGVSPSAFAYYGEVSSGGVTSTKTTTYPLPTSYGTRNGNDDGWRYNVYATYTAASGGHTESVPSGTLRLTSFAPNTYRSMPEPIPSSNLRLTSFAPNATVIIPPIVKQVPSSTLRLNGSAPSTYMNVVKQIPSATLRLTGFAPTDTVTTPGAITEQIPSSSIRLTGFAPNITVNNPVTITKQIPSATLRLTGVAPLDYKNIVEPVPSSNLTITSFAPNAYVVSPGTEQIPPAYLRLVSFAPTFVNTGREEPARRAAGGGVRHRPQKLVIIGKKRYRIDSYDQLVKLLRDYIREQQQELEEVQVNTKKKKKIKLLQNKIEKAEVRLAKANEEWQQAIQQENEDIILMLVA